MRQFIAANRFLIRWRNRWLAAITLLSSGDKVRPGNSEGNGWPDPHPLAAKIEPEPYPLDALPDTIRAAVEEVAGFVKAPVPLVASSALAALSLALPSAHVDAKRAEKLHGPVGLFLLTIADSGERKSTCDGFFTSAIRHYQEEQAEAMKPAIKESPGGDCRMGSRTRRDLVGGKGCRELAKTQTIDKLRARIWLAICNTTSRNRHECRG